MPPSRARPLAFFALTLALAVPFWIAGQATGAMLLPGLPFSGLIAVCPGAAALILAARDGGATAAGRLFARAFDVRALRPLIWLAPALLLMPALRALAFAVARLEGQPVPEPQIALAPTLALFALFFAGAVGEEIGWSGYAIDPLQARFGALKAALLLGAVWAIFHFIGLAQAHRSLEWAAWWTLGTLAARVLIVWIYNGAGRSVLAAALFHMTENVTWQLFPVHGSWWDPRISALIGVSAALAVTLVWGPATLAGRSPRAPAPT